MPASYHYSESARAGLVADGQQSGLAGELPGRGLDDERRAEEVQDLGLGGWYTHRLLLDCGQDLARQQVRRVRRAKIPDPG